MVKESVLRNSKHTLPRSPLSPQVSRLENLRTLYAGCLHATHVTICAVGRTVTLEARMGTFLLDHGRVSLSYEVTHGGRIVTLVVTLGAEGCIRVTVAALVRYSPGIWPVLLLELGQMRYRRAMAIVTELLQVTHLTLAQIFDG